MDIFKAVIPAGGLGTRFLPFTKAVPKEMLPILNKPALHYILQEGIQSGISHYTIITSRGKEALVNYCDPYPELDALLKEHNKQELLADLNHLLNKVQCAYIRQSEALGLGHAIGLARNFIGKEYFGIFLPDDIIFSKKAALDQLITIARQEKASVIAVQEVPMNALSSYGIISVKKQLTPSLYQINGVVEKPSQKDAPSNLAIIGRYVLSHKIFESIEAITPHATHEIQLTDAISHMMNNGEKVFAYKIQGQRFDTGTPSGWLRANIHAGLQHPYYAKEIKAMLQDVSLDLLAYQKPHVITSDQP
jgi:UTP--glucose-1-phosphate uridylyltransferase